MYIDTNQLGAMPTVKPTVAPRGGFNLDRFLENVTRGVDAAGRIIQIVRPAKPPTTQPTQPRPGYPIYQPNPGFGPSPWQYVGPQPAPPAAGPGKNNTGLILAGVGLLAVLAMSRK